MDKKNRNIFNLLLLTMVILGIIMIYAIIPTDYLLLKYVFLRLFTDNNTVYEVTKEPKNLQISRKRIETINLSQIVKLRKMLEEEQFDSLNAILEEYQDIFRILKYSRWRLTRSKRLETSWGTKICGL